MSKYFIKDTVNLIAASKVIGIYKIQKNKNYYNYNNVWEDIRVL